MMNKKISFLFLTVSLSMTISIASIAQAPQAYLKIISEAMRKATPISTDFNVRSGARPLASGNAIIKGEEFHLKGKGLDLLCDGKKIYSYDGVHTLSISPAAPALERSLGPEIFFSERFSSDFTATEAVKNTTTLKLTILPKDKRKNFRRIELFVHTATMLPYKAVIVPKSTASENIVLELQNLKTKVHLPVNYFEFQRSRYPKNLQILD